MTDLGDLSTAIGATAACHAWRRGEITNAELRDMILGIRSRHQLVTLSVLPEIVHDVVRRRLVEVLADEDRLRDLLRAARRGDPWTPEALGLGFEEVLAEVGQAAAEGTLPPLPA